MNFCDVTHDAAHGTTRDATHGTGVTAAADVSTTATSVQSSSSSSSSSVVSVPPHGATSRHVGHTRNTRLCVAVLLLALFGLCNALAGAIGTSCTATAVTFAVLYLVGAVSVFVLLSPNEVHDAGHGGHVTAGGGSPVAKTAAAAGSSHHQ